MGTYLPSTINFSVRTKMAAFDFDWTLVKPKHDETFPKNADDWEWLYHEVPNKLKELYDDDYMIVIFTNQSKQWKLKQIDAVMKDLKDNYKIETYAIIVMDKTLHKPNTHGFDEFMNHNNNTTIDKSKSFFVGDALGRKSDFSDSDKEFAKNIGVSCFSPEYFFKPKFNYATTDIPDLDGIEPEVIIVVGYPGSGKSYIARHIEQSTKIVKRYDVEYKYIHLEKDEFKTSKKLIKKAEEFVSPKKHSIIFDGTNPSKKNRKEYIDFALKHGYNKVRCLHLDISLDEAFKRNKCRPADKQVPRVAYYVFRKNFEKPDVEEGFDSIITV